MIKIYFNNKKIYLTKSYQVLSYTVSLTSAIISFNFDSHKLQNLIDDLQISENENLILVGNPEEILKNIKAMFKLIQAGGGVVLSPKNEIAFIYRRRKWDLPKGKLDEGELIEECALREVEEETGLLDLYIDDMITITYHIYLEDQMILKETYWYKMHSKQKQMMPQLSEGIKKAIWVHPNNIQFQLSNTYESIVDVINIYRN